MDDTPPDVTAHGLFALHPWPLLRVRADTGAVLAGNGAAGRLLGRDPAGQPLAELLRPRSERAAQMLRPPRGGRGRFEAAGRPMRLRLRWLGAGPGVALLVVRPADPRPGAEVFRTIFDHIPILLAVFDADSRVRHINPALEQTFGWALADYSSRDVLAEIYPDPAALQQVRDHLRQADGVWRDFVGRTRDGRQIITAWSNIRLSDGRKVGIGQDVTDRQRSAEELGRERSLLRHLLDSLPDQIAVKSRKGVYLGCNAAYERHVGRRERDLIGLSAEDLPPPPGLPRAAWEEELAWEGLSDRLALAEGRPVHTERQLGPEGPLYEVVKVPHFGGDRAILGLISVRRDVTERRRLEEQLRQAQKLEAVGQLAGGIAHDFNNLLTIILGHLSHLLGPLPPAHPMRSPLENVQTAALRAAELTANLLGYARRKPLQLRPVDPAALFYEVTGILRPTIDPRIELTWQIVPGTGPVLADAGQLQQVLLNLCLNARDAMPEGGKLTLAAAACCCAPAAGVRPGGDEPGEYVRLEVTDTGTGMPPEVRARLFEPFFTTKPPGQGTGLGLAMVYGIVRQHQGWVECASAAGAGTTFALFLPPAAATAEGPAAAAQPVGTLRGSESVLVVDDEPMIRDLARAVLERAGYRTLAAADGVEAVETYLRHAGQIDLILLDQSMPRMSGPDALRRISQEGPPPRVLLSSGFASEDLGDPAGLGVCGFVQKPYRADDLLRAVRQALDDR